MKHRHQPQPNYGVWLISAIAAAVLVYTLFTL